MKFSRKTVLDRITAGPTRYSDMVGSSRPDRKSLRKVIDRLVADGTIKQVYIDRLPYYVLENWQPTEIQVLQAIESRWLRYGVSTQTISAIRRHEIWKERATGMFSGLINGRRAA